MACRKEMVGHRHGLIIEPRTDRRWNRQSSRLGVLRWPPGVARRLRGQAFHPARNASSSCFSTGQGYPAGSFRRRPVADPRADLHRCVSLPPRGLAWGCRVTGPMADPLVPFRRAAGRVPDRDRSSGPATRRAKCRPRSIRLGHAVMAAPQFHLIPLVGLLITGFGVYGVWRSFDGR